MKQTSHTVEIRGNNILLPHFFHFVELFFHLTVRKLSAERDGAFLWLNICAKKQRVTKKKLIFNVVYWFSLFPHLRGEKKMNYFFYPAFFFTLSCFFFHTHFQWNQFREKERFPVCMNVQDFFSFLSSLITFCVSM